MLNTVNGLIAGSHLFNGSTSLSVILNLLDTKELDIISTHGKLAVFKAKHYLTSFLIINKCININDHKDRVDQILPP